MRKLILAEQIDQWFKHLASWEATLEEMAAASTDQNFTEELGAIEQCEIFDVVYSGRKHS
jgi:cephalosporin-C deacetylase-like acetyl esterase